MTSGPGTTHRGDSGSLFPNGIGASEAHRKFPLEKHTPAVATHPHEPETAPVLDAEGRCLVCALAVANEEANRLLNRAEAAEAKAIVFEAALRKIAEEPPNRGLTPDFRRFARDVLEAYSRG